MSASLIGRSGSSAFRLAFTSAALLASVISLVAAVAGEPEKASVTSDWRVECTNSLKALDCRAFLEVVQKNTNQVITALPRSAYS